MKKLFLLLIIFTISHADFLDTAAVCGDTVWYIATPNFGYVLSNWVVDSGTCKLYDSLSDTVGAIPNGTAIIHANFILTGTNQFTLTIANDGHGTNTPTTGSVDSNSANLLTNVPAMGYRFQKWGRTASSPVSPFKDSTANPTYDTVRGAVTITSYDTIIHYQLTMTNSTPAGTLTPASGLVDSGAVITLSYTPPTGYGFKMYTRSSANAVFGAGANDSSHSGATVYLKAAATITAVDTLIPAYVLPTYAATCVYVRGYGTASFTSDSGTVYQLRADSSFTWDSSAAVIGSTTGGAHLSSTGIKNPTVWFSAAGTVTATFYLRNPRIPVPTKPAQGDTVNKSVVWTFNKYIDSVVILTRYSDSGSTVIGRDTTTANSVTKIISDSSKSFYSLKGGTGTTWSAQSAIVGFWTGKASGGNSGRGGFGFGFGFRNWWNRAFR